MHSIICVANHLLASCSKENLIRFWDFVNSDNFVLDIEQVSRFKLPGEVVSCIAYNEGNCKLKGVEREGGREGGGGGKAGGIGADPGF